MVFPAISRVSPFEGDSDTVGERNKTKQDYALWHPTDAVRSRMKVDWEQLYS